MISDKSRSYVYHCSHCGAVFNSNLGYDVQRICGTCGDAPNVARSKAESKELSGFIKKAEMVHAEPKRKFRKPRKADSSSLLVVIFVVVLCAVVASVYWLKYSERVRSNAKDSNNDAARNTTPDENRELLRNVLPECHRRLAAFLGAGSNEVRKLHILNADEVSMKMDNFYRANPFPRVDITKLRRIGQAVTRDGEERVIVTRWKEEGEYGIEFEAVFREVGEAWKLDWEHFHQYSEASWENFLEGEGASSGEFRLLARFRKSSGTTDRSGARITFVMMAPVWGRPKELGIESPDMVVDRRSDEGLLLQAAWEKRDEGLSVFDKVLPAMEPEGLIQVCVRVRRDEFGGVRSFHLEKIHACHWVTSRNPGFDLERLKDDLFPEH